MAMKSDDEAADAPRPPITAAMLDDTMERLWNGGALSREDTPQGETARGDNPSIRFGSRTMGEVLITLLLVLMAAWMPDVLQGVATSVAESPEVVSWLGWIDHVLGQDWPPTVAVWGVLHHSEAPGMLDDLVPAWFAQPQGWDHYFGPRQHLASGRAAIVDEAIAAYKAGFYAAATTLFLTQVDGVIYDTTDKRRRQYHLIKAMLRRFPPSLQKWTGAVERVLDDAWAPWEPERGAGFNRHRILHGLGTDFNTPQDALKAAMWVEMVWYLSIASAIWTESSTRQTRGFDRFVRAMKNLVREPKEPAAE